MFFKKKVHIHLPLATVELFEAARKQRPDKISIKEVENLRVHASISLAKERMNIELNSDGKGATQIMEVEDKK